MDYLNHLIIVLAIWVIIVVGLDILAGHLGIFSLAQASFFAVGAYGYAITTTAFGWSFLSAMVVAIGSGVLLSLAVSLASWRLRRDFLVLATLSLQMTVYHVIRLWAAPTEPLGSWSNLTNGTSGIAHIPRLWIGVEKGPR